jgi:uncharacterized protein (DUF427 family)
VNYRIEGPERLLFFGDFPRRVRAMFGDQTVLDTRRGRLLHETDLLPVLYVPEADLDRRLLHRTDHTTHCPYKGHATYWSVQVGGRAAENAVWAYPAPLSAARWLRGYRAVSWEAVAWSYEQPLDDAARIAGHLCFTESASVEVS